jgi:D-serine deaminase-like pyridoxal phosphate-dependent protein
MTYLPGTALGDVDTPALIVDMDVMDANIERMAAFARERGIALRAHVKNHKIPELAWRQVRAGAVGIVCQKLGEAEVMADAGLEDILIPYPIIGPIKVRRLLALARRARVITVVDSREGAAAISAAAVAEGQCIPTMIEVDIGYHRCGVSPDEAASLAAAITAELPGLRFAGLMAYEGHVYSLTTPEEVEAEAVRSFDRLAGCAAQVRARGIPVDSVSSGSSVTYRSAAANGSITEVRAGGYLFGDRSVVALGGSSQADCSLTVLSTVVSVRGSDHVVIDAGAKALSLATLDGLPGFGLIIGHEESPIVRIADEHGMIQVPADGRPFAIGERVQIIPNEHTVVVNQFSELIGVRAGRVEHVWPIAARGLMQ